MFVNKIVFIHIRQFYYPICHARFINQNFAAKALLVSSPQSLEPGKSRWNSKLLTQRSLADCKRTLTNHWSSYHLCYVKRHVLLFSHCFHSNWIHKWFDRISKIPKPRKWSAANWRQSFQNQKMCWRYCPMNL